MNARADGPDRHIQRALVKERTRERLRGEVVGEAVPDPPSKVVVHPCVTALEQHSERLGMLERAGDHRLV
jgi:hypothetical protein